MPIANDNSTISCSESQEYYVQSLYTDGWHDLSDAKRLTLDDAKDYIFEKFKSGNMNQYRIISRAEEVIYLYGKV